MSQRSSHDNFIKGLTLKCTLGWNTLVAKYMDGGTIGYDAETVILSSYTPEGRSNHASAILSFNHRTIYFSIGDLSASCVLIPLVYQTTALY